MQLNSLAQSLQVLRGSLSRWLLPYDHNTRIDEQSSTLQSVLRTVPESLQDKMSPRQISYLVTGLNGVRKLIRIKIADDNDLEQAREALKMIVAFFKELHEAVSADSMETHTYTHDRSMFSMLEWWLTHQSTTVMTQSKSKR